MSDLLGLLLSLPYVSSDTIRQRLEIATDAKVAIYRLRGDLAKHNIKIHARRGFGYWIDDQTKNQIRERVTDQVTVDQQNGATT